LLFSNISHGLNLADIGVVVGGGSSVVIDGGGGGLGLKLIIPKIFF